MADIVRKITLTELGANPGPNFSVQYSTDCSTYTQSVDCTNIFLPSVGSFAYCTMDSNTTCIRLTSLTPECGNSVIEDIRPTTTSTTTLEPTTSTTTLEPTTSTTTLEPTTSTTTLEPTTSTTTLEPTTTTTTLVPTTTLAPSTTTTLAPSTTTTLVPTTTTTDAPTTTTTDAPTTTTVAPTTTSTTTVAPTTTTTTQAPTTTSTTTPITGTCRFVWYQDTVDSERYGLRYFLPNVGQTDTEFTNLFSTAYNYGGNDGFVVSVCSTIVPQTWDSLTNTVVSLGSEVVNLEDGGTCSVNNDCEFVPPTTTTTTVAPTTTLAPTTTIAPTTTVAPTTTTTTVFQETIYTHGAVRATCSDYCNTNYNITTLTNADGDYNSLTLGDTIYGQGGVAGYVAYSNVSTDTSTGPFRIAQIDSSGVVIDISVCVGGNCEPL